MWVSYFTATIAENVGEPLTMQRERERGGGAMVLGWNILHGRHTKKGKSDTSSLLRLRCQIRYTCQDLV